MLFASEGTLLVWTSFSCSDPSQITYLMSVFSSPLCLCKIILFLSFTTFAIPFLLSLRLLSVFIKMKASFDVRFWSPGWPNTTYPYRIDKYINKEIWFQPSPCLLLTDQSGEVPLHVGHQQLQLLLPAEGRGPRKHHFLLRSQWQNKTVNYGHYIKPISTEFTWKCKLISVRFNACVPHIKLTEVK